MAISDSQKVDYLFKKIGYSVTKTDTATVKSPSNESIASPISVRSSSIWAQSDAIPTTIPSTNTSVVTVYNDALGATIQASNDATAGTNRTWKTNLSDWIDSSYGSTYQVKVYLATTGNTSPQTSGVQLFADGSGNNDEWFFDYTSGILNFIGTNLPSQSFIGKSIFISGARYLGNKGLGALGNISANDITSNEIYVNGYRVLTSNSNVQINGDAIGSGTYDNINVILSNTGVIAGTYGSADDEIVDTVPKITVDSKGRITNIANVTLTQIGNVSFNNTTITANDDMTVTAIGNIYLNAQNTGIVHILGTDAVSIPAGTTSDRPFNSELGYIRFNTDSETLEYWTGTEWSYPGAATITSETITPDGINDSYILNSDATPDGLIVSINGTLQQPFTSYTMTGNVITFVEIPQDTDIVEVRHIAAGATSVSSLKYGVDTRIELTTGNILATGNLTISNSITIQGNTIVANTYVPSSANSAGTTGQIVWDNGHVYICVATNSWKRANLSTW